MACARRFAPFFNDKFEERFIYVALDESTGQPTAATCEALRTDLKCVTGMNAVAAHAHDAVRACVYCMLHVHSRAWSVLCCMPREDEFASFLLPMLEHALVEFAKAEGCEVETGGPIGSPFGPYMKPRTRAATGAARDAAGNAAGGAAAAAEAGGGGTSGVAAAIEAEAMEAEVPPAPASGRRPARDGKRAAAAAGGAEQANAEAAAAAGAEAEGDAGAGAEEPATKKSRSGTRQPRGPAPAARGGARGGGGARGRGRPEKPADVRALAKAEGERDVLKRANSVLLAKVQALEAKLATSVDEKATAQTERAAAVEKFEKLEATTVLKIKLAVAEAKMKCGGLMLSHFMGTGARAGVRDAAADTPGQASPGAGLDLFTAFFTAE